MEAISAALAVTGSLWLASVTRANLPAALPATGFTAIEPKDKPDKPDKQARQEALARAAVWQEPPVPIEQADLRDGPGPVGPGSDVAICKFHPDKTSGATPKFDCVFGGGEVLKVKYGRNPEVHTEVAAARLLRALGAGSDHMYLVGTLRCFGCPEDPYVLLSCVSSPLDAVRNQCQPLYGEVTPNGAFKLKVDYTKYVDFEGVAVERKLEGRIIEAEDGQGWGWDELSPKHGSGAQRAERDALRLLAVFLNNWDNRPDNQRLICPPGAETADGGCARPFAFMHDLGATFGRVGGEKAERKLDLEGWREVPIWKDAAACTVSIDSPPLHGATFGEAVITESGRRFLADRLGRLTRDQVRGLVEGARFAHFEDASPASRSVDHWVSVFEAKVRQITARPPCPNP